MALLEVRDLRKWYGRREVVRGVDFDVDQGEIVGLLGPNGAGKTTSFRMTIGLIPSEGGTITFGGREISHLPMYKRAAAGLGYLPQETSVFRQLSVENNLMAIIETRTDLSRRERRLRRDRLMEQFGLTHIRKTKAMYISGGEKRRVEIARCLITEPSLIMLDEPFAGIDPKAVKEIQASIRDLAVGFNLGILLTDHEYRETLEVTDRNYLIHEGQVIAEGNSQTFLQNENVRRHYLGERADMAHLLEHAPHKPAPGSASIPAATPPSGSEANATSESESQSKPSSMPAPAVLDAYGEVIIDTIYGPFEDADDPPSDPPGGSR